MTIDQLRLSPHNARTNAEDKKATEGFKRSLLERGQIMPLIVHPMKGPRRDPVYGVFAGGRRYANFKALIEEGRLPASHPIDVVVRDLSEADLIELSVAENLVRRDLRPYETYTAVVKANRRGNSIAHIAETVGQPEIWVTRAIRLGTLARPVFEAFEAGTIDEKEAAAYGAIADEELQLATYRELADRPPLQRNVAAIHRHMKIGDGEALRLLHFVGEDAYLAAGGRIEPDLFDDREQGRALIRDEPILRGLVDQRFASVREATRVRFNRPDLPFRTEAPRTQFGGEDVTLEYHPDGDVMRDGDIFATIVVPPAQDGRQPEPLVRFWWASNAAKHGGAKRSAGPKPKTLSETFGGRSTSVGAALDDRASPGATKAANDAIREETGISPATIDVFQAVTRVIKRAMLVDNADDGETAGLDFLVWTQLRAKLRPMEVEPLGVRRLPAAEADGEEGRAEVRRTDADARWRHALRTLEEQDFIREEDLGEAFRFYRSADRYTKNMAAAVLCCFTLDRPINFGDYRLPIHEVLVAEMGHAGSDLRGYWSPTTTLLDRIPARERLAIVDPFVERVTLGSWQRLKSADLTQRVIEVVTGTSTAVKASMAEAARRWIHPLLALSPPETEGDDGDPEPANDIGADELAEAAE